MKVLDAGTQVLDDYDVLRFIQDKQAQHKRDEAAAKADERKTSRPANYVKALKKHEAHLADPSRPFANNPHYKADQSHLSTLIQTLSPKVSLTKTEYLILVNQRPYRRSQLQAMIEDVDTRFAVEKQDWILKVVGEVLGVPEPKDGQAEG